VTKRPRQPSADPYRKARFRELAREIVGKDRHDRRSGYAVDTAGGIARALEQAFREGFDAARISGPSPAAVVLPDDGPMEWALIPPRPRTTFWSICLFCLGRRDLPQSEAQLVPAITQRGTPGWRLTTSNGRDIRVIGEKSIIPLVRLGLLTLTNETSPRLLVSDRGQLTWERFLDRGGHYPEDLTISGTIFRD